VTTTSATERVWHRLSPRMLLVHPVHEVLRQIPLLAGAVVLGSATGNSMWAVAALGVTIGFGVLRWFTTTYRIEPDEVQLRSGVFQRKVVSVPRNRIRSVATEARLLHQLLGLTVLRVSTGQQVRGDSEFALDAVRAEEVPRLRSILLADSLAPSDEIGENQQQPDRLLARWQPSWLRYSPLSFTGLAMIVGAVGIVYQAGLGAALQHSRLAESGRDAAERFGVIASVAVVVAVVVFASVVLSVLRSLVTYGNLVLVRRDAAKHSGVLHLTHGLLRKREHTFDLRRLRGGTVRQPLLVRLLGGARLDAVMTGVAGAGEASLLLPPCPARTTESVLTDLIDDADAVSGPVHGHGAAATRRRWTRGLAFPVVVAACLLAASAIGAVPSWAWILVALLALCCALLAADRARALGHRVDGRWLVARSGSLERRRDCIAADGIIGWTVRQTFFQRRAGVATLVAATAAGVKHYQVIDVPAERSWSIAGTASPWVADSQWARP
jgi:putative membrane protein